MWLLPADQRSFDFSPPLVNIIIYPAIRNLLVIMGFLSISAEGDGSDLLLLYLV